jgi:PIN domain nuclease of toxin-antitoxin system
MRLFLDTHVIWWLLSEPERMRRETLAMLTDAAASLHYSPLSMLELAIGRAKGRLAYDDAVLLGGIDGWPMAEVPVRRSHTIRAGNLPRHHGDPFDRLIIAQAAVDGFTLVSADGAFRHYDVALLPA